MKDFRILALGFSVLSFGGIVAVLYTPHLRETQPLCICPIEHPAVDPEMHDEVAKALQESVRRL